MTYHGQITYRAATGDDINSLWEIDQLCFSSEMAYPADIFYFHLLVNRDPSFVALDEKGKIVGFIMTSMEAPKTGVIITIDVMKNRRGKGTGTKLMALAEEALKARGAKKIVLQTAVDNAVAIKFYEKLGYKQMERIPDYYHAGKDAFLFEKR
jgi:ribosomal protein S18 acetylase RimI-like enzyme